MENRKKKHISYFSYFFLFVSYFPWSDIALFIAFSVASYPDTILEVYFKSDHALFHGCEPSRHLVLLPEVRRVLHRPGAEKKGIWQGKSMKISRKKQKKKENTEQIGKTYFW